ncbi:MAG: hypothetical protein JST75_20440 [Bacteroidetes bacterium]|nr:hypothetical protein [Bacteroidota bacterium]
MSDNIEQKNFLGDNMVDSTKKIINRHRKQGFFAAVAASILAAIIYEYLIRPLL